MNFIVRISQPGFPTTTAVLRGVAHSFDCFDFAFALLESTGNTNARITVRRVV